MKQKTITSLMALMVVCCAILAFNTTDKAPVARIGYVSGAGILSVIPELKTAQAEVDTLSATLQAQLQSKVSEYKQKAKALEEESAQLNELIRKDREDELENLQASIQKFSETANQAIAEKERELIMPFHTQVKEAIASIAKARGFTHVLNSDATGASLFLYAEEYTALDSLVIKNLN